MAAKNPQDYALVIGINHYPNYRPLQGAVEDAKEFSEWLVDQNVGGGLDPANCKTILSSDQPLRPVWDDIDVTLAELRKQAAASGGRRFYLYFSGHGHAGESEDVNLCLGRWAPAGSSRVALSANGYYRFFAECVGFKEIVVLLDCCRVRVVGAAGMQPGESCPKPLDTAGKVRFFKAFATEFQSASYEAAGQGEDNSLVRGHFTRALITALRGGAASAEGGVKPSTLKAYLEREVPRIAALSKHNQTTRVAQNDLPDETTSYFGSAPPAAPANIRIRFKAERVGEVALIGPDDTELKRALASAGPWTLTLSKGLYLLSDLTTGESLPIRFSPQEDLTDVNF